MSNVALDERVAHLVDPSQVESLDVLGPTIQLLTLPEEDGAPCIMRGTIPPGVSVPIHCHADPETFLHLSGGLEGLTHAVEGFTWVRIEPGALFHVPSGAKHAFRNRSREPAVSVVVTTPRLGRFFREVGTPVPPEKQPSGPPSQEAIRRFMEVSKRYGYWNATPEENAQVGLRLPPAG